MWASIIWVLYRNILKPILFLFDPEKIHELFGSIGVFLGKYWWAKKITKWLFHYENKKLHQTVAGVTFSNPVWVAAWFDKDINLPNIIGHVWFWWEEIGSITAKPYSWNKGKRLFRLKKSGGLVVNYWLKNKWVEYADKKILQTNANIPLFVSIAKTNNQDVCEYAKGIDDYVESFQKLKNNKNIQWFTLNISCPNSFWWEDYAKPDRLIWLLQAIQKIELHKPLFVKMPVDASVSETLAVVDICLHHGVSGVIVGNLTKQRDDKINKKELEKIKDIPGWISWLPTKDKSTLLIWEIYKTFWNKIIIVWCGGIFSAQDAYDKIKNGATLLQLITGMIFNWPQLIWKINKWLIDLLKKDWYEKISDAIWANFK